MSLRKLILLIFLLVPLSSAGEAFPEKGTYYFFVLGEYSGKTVFQSSVEDSYLIIKSQSSLKFEDFDLKLDCITKVEKNTLKPVSFTYEGIKPINRKVYGHVYFKGDSIIGEFRENENKFTSRRTIGVIPVFFENYVAEHEILLARRALDLEGGFGTVFLFFPSDFFLSKSSAIVASEVELKTNKGPIVVTKIEFSQEGSIPFYSYLDMGKKIPIYIDFPGSSTEVFLEGYFDENAKTKYHRLEKK